MPNVMAPSVENEEEQKFRNSIPCTIPQFKARGYAYAKIEYVSVRTYLSKNRIRV